MKKDHPETKPSGERRENDESGENRFLVVGLGASAGGIQALREFFNEVSSNSGLAFVVILHMSPAHESSLAEILQHTSSIPVTQVHERVKVEPNHVYVVPPNRILAMSDGHLDLKAMIGVEERRSPVDLFFRTLAEASEDRAVSVILSGTGANGSMGIKRIKEFGGVNFAQDPGEAEYKDMPTNAIGTGLVDYVLPVGQIPGQIISYKEHIGNVKIPEPPKEVAKTDEQALIEIFTLLRVRTGHDFSNYKRATMLRRIERRLRLRELTSLPEYARYLREQPLEVHMFLKDLLINVTNFFRDSESLQAIGEQVIPRILENKQLGEPVRVWVAGCATGEEAYSIAMLFSERASSEEISPMVQVFATDLDDAAIKIAREGLYKEAEVADISPERLRRFFSHEIDGYRVRRELRENILFAVHNVLKDPPFSHVDLISCRNLLIYLNRTAQSRVLEVFHFALNPTAFLFLGASESVEGASDFFNVMDKDHHIYRSRPIPPKTFPIAEISASPSVSVPRILKTSQEKRANERLSYADIHQRLLEKYAVPSVVINEEYEIVHLSDSAGRYLEFSGGEPTQNLLKLLKDGLRLEVRTALYKAIRDGIDVRAEGLRVVTDDGPKTVNVIARPTLRDDDSTRGFVLVLFEEADPQPASPPVSVVSASDEPLARRLEKELAHAKSQLRTTVEQYEIQQEELKASNEELQAMNEELRSAAEELETSKEELQSVNEELTTVNQELKIKIEELSHSNNNFQNLMNSTNIGTIFLDRSLCVRQFTPTAKETFNLISSDLGRPLTDITSRLKHDGLFADMETVLDNLQAIERKVITHDDDTFMMRIFPYRTLDDKIEGLVITMVDVSELARAEDEIRRAGEEMENRVEVRTSELADTNLALRSEIRFKHQAEAESRRLLEQLVSAQEQERKRLARDLHDQLGQQLTALQLSLESLRSKQSPQGLAAVDEIQKIVKRLDADIDFLAWELRPVALDELGLEAGLKSYVEEWSKHFNIEAEFHSRGLGEIRLGFDVESNLYRIAQEALNNCAKHAKCKQAYIILERRGNHVVLIVEDNGVGFDLSERDIGRSMGIVSMRERALLISGTFEVESKAHEGTAIFIRVPLVPEDDNGTK
jgi:two-component system CheB/CheR fusion protein